MSDREIYVQLIEGLLQSFEFFSPSPFLVARRKPAGRGEVKGMPDISVELPERDWRVAVEVTWHRVTEQQLQSRLTRLRQMSYAGVTWYLHPDANVANNERWLWQQKQEGYVLQFNETGELQGWRDITCPRKVWERRGQVALG